MSKTKDSKYPSSAPVPQHTPLPHGVPHGYSILPLAARVCILPRFTDTLSTKGHPLLYNGGQKSGRIYVFLRFLGTTLEALETETKQNF